MIDQSEIDTEHKDILRETEKQGALFRGVFEGSCDALLLLTAEGSLFDCNQRILEMFGFADKDDFIRTHLSRLFPELQPDGAYSCLTLSKHIATAITAGSCRFDWVFRNRDGSDFSAKVRMSSFPVGEKTVLQVSVREL